MSEPQSADPINEDRIKKAKAQIDAMCNEAFSRGYTAGYERGFTFGVRAAAALNPETVHETIADA